MRAKHKSSNDRLSSNSICSHHTPWKRKLNQQEKQVLQKQSVKRWKLHSDLTKASMREPLIAPGSPLTNFCARGTQLKGEIRTTVYTFYMDDSTPFFLSFLGISYTVINWLRNHLWCPNDPHGLEIDDEMIMMILSWIFLLFPRPCVAFCLQGQNV